MTIVDTSTTALATAHYSQRKIDRNQDGTLWAIFMVSATASELWYSKDNGATWTQSGGTLTGVQHPAIFTDLDDYLHIAWKQDGTASAFGGGTLTHQGIYYVRGTPNAGRTAWTWGNYLRLHDVSSYTYPDLVAFRSPDASGYWDIAVVASYVNGSTNYPWYIRLRTNDGLTMTTDRDGLTAEGSGGRIANTYGIAAHTSPSIDFHHTGDGKTVAGGVAHLYVGWTTGSASNGLRFRKAVNASGAWTWNAERTMGSYTWGNLPTHWLNTLYDGTRVVLAGQLVNTTPQTDLIAYERDEADTATTTRVLITNVSGADYLMSGSASYDAAGNLYYIGRDGTGANGTRKLNVRKWTRATTTLEALSTLESTASDTPYVSAKRGYGGSSTGIDVVYTDKTSTPWDAVFLRAVSLNVAPNAPALTGPGNNATLDRSITQRFSWTFSDPDAGDTQSEFELQYRIGAGSWTTVTGTTPNNFYDFAPAALAAGTYEWQVRTKDSQGLQGAWSASSFVTMANAPAVPTITSPASGAVIGLNSVVVQWSAPSQEAYEVRRVADNAGNPDTATVYATTGTVVDAAGRSRTMALETNNRYEHLQVRVRVAGLWSTWGSVRIQVSFTPPNGLTVFLTPQAASGRMEVVIANAAPGGGQPVVVHNEIWRRNTNGYEGGFKRVAIVAVNATWYDYAAAGDSVLEYYAVAVGSNGTETVSATVTATLPLRGIWLGDPADWSTLHRFPWDGEGRNVFFEPEVSLNEYVGRKFPVAEFGAMAREQVRMPLPLDDESGDREAYQSLIRRTSVLLYRDGRGRKMYCVLQSENMQDTHYGGKVDFAAYSVDYDEAV